MCDKEYIKKCWEKQLLKQKLESAMLQLTVISHDLQEWDEHMLLKDMCKACHIVCYIHEFCLLIAEIDEKLCQFPSKRGLWRVPLLYKPAT